MIEVYFIYKLGVAFSGYPIPFEDSDLHRVDVFRS